MKRSAALLVACWGCGAPPPGAGVDVAGGAREIVMSASAEPGQEVTLCQHVDVGASVGDVDIERLSHHFDGRSHHFFVYASSTAGADAEPRACDDEAHRNKGGLLYASQRADDALSFPDGVALTIDRGGTLLIEWHVVNTSAERIDAEAQLSIAYAAEAPAMRAGMLVYYHPFIHVPAQGSSHAAMHCRVPEDVTLMWTSSHMHARGTGYRSSVVRGDGISQPLHVTDAWEDVGLTLLDDLAVSRGDAIAFSCDFDNPSDRVFIEGDSARDDEMCMFFAGYYPRVATPHGEGCSGPGSGPRFDGRLSCADAFTCLQEASDDVDRSSCWTAASEVSSEPLLQLAHRCKAARCGEACAAGFDAACTHCLDERCADDVKRCHDAPS